MSSPTVEVAMFDTSLRDGAQALPDEHQFPEGTKPMIGDQIASLGVDVIEAGFPRTAGDAIEVAKVARTVGQTVYTVSNWQNGTHTGDVSQSPIIAGLSRTTPEDIDATWEAVADAQRARIHTFVSTDPAHMAAKFPGKSPDDVLMMAREAIRYSRQLTDEHPNADVEFSAEAASTTDMAYLESVIQEALQQGANIINVPDTVGERDPFWMHDFYTQVIGWVMQSNPDAVISAHNHNDNGLAVANTNVLVRAAVDYARKHEQGVRIQLEGTICGIGERAGNANEFPVAASLFKFSADASEVSVNWRFNPQNSVRVARAVMSFAGFEVDRQTPIVGRDTMVHRSGIHSDGVAKGGHRIYTPHDPTFWGHEADAVHEDGRYQGKRGKLLVGAAAIKA